MRMKGISESILQYCHSRLATFLIYAIKRRWRLGNPLRFVPKPKPENKAARRFADEELAAILNTAITEFSGHYYAITHTALHTGIRMNEFLTFTWRDVDVDLGTINVS